MRADTQEQALLSRAETAKYFGVSIATVDRWVKRNDFPKPIKIGLTVRFKKANLDEFINAQAHA